ncbi:MAG TPA: sodium/solute symporter [Kiritimatiellia bacterium]|nr:sodium/solute symporter [Kiritimatiellia bacterium]HMO97737.1 sodium/solute symporter [Kiritimatiellia bacterium]
MTSDPGQFGALNYAILTLYLIGMIAVGAYFSRRQQSLQDYFLGGRRLPWLAVGMSMYASVTSAMTFMGLPGRAYSQNISLLVVCLMSPLIAPVLIYLIFPLYRKLGLTTSYEYIAMRFGRCARIAVSGLFVLARLSWIGTVIYAPSLALHVTTGIPLAIAALIIGLLATVYCVLGGLSAVIWTDVPQFIIMIGGAIWVAVLLSGLVPDGVVGILREGHLADKLMIFDWTLKPDHMTALAVALAYGFILIQDYGVDQVSVQRLLAVKTDRGVARAVIFNAVTDFFIIGLLLLIGLGLFVYYQQHPGQLPDGIAADRVLPWFILHQLPAGISGLIIAALFAAAMSSVDSGLNSLTTVILNDIAGPLTGRKAESVFSVGLARVLTAVLGLLATAVAIGVYRYIGDIIRAFYTFMGLFSAPVLAFFLLGMLTRRAHALGWGVAAATSIALILTIKRLGWLHEIYFFPASTLFTFICGYLLSLVLPVRGSHSTFTWRGVLRT